MALVTVATLSELDDSVERLDRQNSELSFLFRNKEFLIIFVPHYEQLSPTYSITSPPYQMPSPDNPTKRPREENGGKRRTRRKTKKHRKKIKK